MPFGPIGSLRRRKVQQTALLRARGIFNPRAQPMKIATAAPSARNGANGIALFRAAAPFRTRTVRPRGRRRTRRRRSPDDYLGEGGAEKNRKLHVTHAHATAEEEHRHVEKEPGSRATTRSALAPALDRVRSARPRRQQSPATRCGSGSSALPGPRPSRSRHDAEDESSPDRCALGPNRDECERRQGSSRRDSYDGRS